MKSPIFLLSLPRSGSTLLQRLLGAHNEIATVSEPWFLLPMVYSQRREGTLSEYSHRNSSIALKDLISNLPNTQDDYDDAIRKFSLDVYQKLCTNKELYFLDKTPRYHLIAKDLIRIFPDAKFIFLFRNPLDIYASVMKTWGNNTFKRMFSSKNDFKFGIQNLISARKILGDNCLVVNYEQLVSETDKTCNIITSFLEIENTFLDNKEGLINLNGTLGDQKGIKKYKKINPSSIGNWKKTFNTRFRKSIAKNYINSIDNSDLNGFGYEKETLLNALKNHKVQFGFSIKDRWHILFNVLAIVANGHLYLTKRYKWVRSKFLS